MIQCQFVFVAICLAFVLSFAETAFCEGGTSIVAEKGEPAVVSPSWPEGAADLVNDPLRTSGWNSWFSEWPNDVNQYAFDIESTDDLNRLIQKLAAIKTDVRQIRLSYLKEPNGLGWVTRVPEGNGIRAIFSIGDQSRIDEWFKHVRKPFGAMEFLATPVAVPPTLTIFVQHKSVKLDQLEISKDIGVTRGYVPTLFHKSNTVIEQQREKEAAAGDEKSERAKLTQNLDESSMLALKNIDTFLESRKASIK